MENHINCVKLNLDISKLYTMNLFEKTYITSYPKPKGSRMKNTLYAVAFASISLSSLYASTDFIEKAISKGQLAVIKTCIKTGYTVGLEDKETYIKLAQQMVDKKKEAAKACCSKSFLTVDSLALAVSVVGIVAMTRDAYDKWDTATGKESYKFWLAPACAMMATKAAGEVIKNYKDVTKEDTKAQDAVANAEKVAQAVSDLAIA